LALFSCFSFLASRLLLLVSYFFSLASCLPAGGLCGFASLRAILFFFAQSLPVGKQGAKPELGQLPPDPPRRISFSRKGAKPQRNLTANGSNLLVLVSYFFALGTLYLVLGTLYLLLDTDYLLLFLMSNAERPVQNGEVGIRSTYESRVTTK
jgi:hypothetical protein